MTNKPKSKPIIKKKMIQCCLNCLHPIFKHDKEKGCIEPDCNCPNRFPYQEAYKSYQQEMIEKAIA